MVSVMTHSSILDNLSCMLLANDGLAGASIADTNDAKVQAETQAKMLHEQIKSMQKHLDAHKYELHVVQKQLQIRNEEQEHHRKESDASYKQHLASVRKIAILESECQRLRSLIRHRLPGPAAIAQMRAECDIHVQMSIKKRSSSAMRSSSPTKSLLNTSAGLEAQREIQSLKERLLFVEDEAKDLKATMTKRTCELQESRQLCARTAMKLAVAQACIESTASTENTACGYSQNEVPFRDGYHGYDLPNLDIGVANSGDLIDTENAIDESCSMVDDKDGVTINTKSENKNSGHIGGDGELDEISCAESWASALVAELCHLSNLHESSSAGTGHERLLPPQGNPHTAEKSTSKTDNVCYDYENRMQSVGTYQALEVVQQRLSSVSGSLLKSLAEDPNAYTGSSSESACNAMHINKESSVCSSKMHANNMLEEILQIKGLLIDIGRATEMGDGCIKSRRGDGKADESACHGEIMGQHRISKWAYWGPKKRGLSRLRINSLETGEGISAELHSEETVTKFGEEFDGDESNDFDQIDETGNYVDHKAVSSPSKNIAKSGFDLGNSIIYKDPAKCSDVSTASGPLNLAGGSREEESDLSKLEGVEKLPHEAWAELERARDRIAALEADLARCLQEKADVDDELRATCAVKKSLETELARIARVDELSSQMPTEVADTNVDVSPHGNVPLLQDEQPGLVNFDLHLSNEKQELVAVGAPLDDCQSKKVDLHQQVSSKIPLLATPDVINDDQRLSDSSSESSKSMDQSSMQLQPSTFDNHLECTLHSKNLAQQACHESVYPTSRLSKSLQESENSTWITTIDRQITKQHALQCKAHNVHVRHKLFSYLTRSFSKDRTTETHLPLAKVPKSSRKIYLLDFFTRI